MVEILNRVTDKHLGKLLSIVQRHTILPFPAENSVYGSTTVNHTTVSKWTASVPDY